MNKLAISVLAVFVAAASHSAIISWGASGGVGANGAEYTSGDYVALVWDSAGDGIDQVNYADGFVAGDDVVALSGSLNASLLYASGNVTVSPGSVFAGVTTSPTSPYTVFANLYVVVYDAAAYGDVRNYLVSTAKGTFTVGTSPVPANNNRNTWGEFTAVPEPTTAALALVGIGAVALRRRFLKK